MNHSLSKGIAGLLLLAVIPILSCCKTTIDTEMHVIDESIHLAGNSWLVNNPISSSEVISSEGISSLSNSEDIVRVWYYTENTGSISLGLRAKVVSGISVLEISSGDDKVNFELSNTEFSNLYVGDFEVAEPGYQYVDIKGLSKESANFASVSHLLLAGEPAKSGIKYVKDDFYFGRRGPSVHLRYDVLPEGSDIQYFYNEITVPVGQDVIGSYFMANGFGQGYFGIQVNSETERRILFSVWSSYKTDDPSSIPDDEKIILLDKGDGVNTGEFGNEGSGGQSYKVFNWEAGTTYGFLLAGKPSANNSTDFTAWFFDPDANEWNLIASFRRPKTSTYLTNLYSFLENFVPNTGCLTREANFSNQWVRDSEGNWTELNKAHFSYDATAKKESRMDYDGGTHGQSFYLKNCGFFNKTVEADDLFERELAGDEPVIPFLQTGK